MNFNLYIIYITSAIGIVILPDIFSTDESIKRLSSNFKDKTPSDAKFSTNTKDFEGTTNSKSKIPPNAKFQFESLRLKNKQFENSRNKQQFESLRSNHKESENLELDNEYIENLIDDYCDYRCY